MVITDVYDKMEKELEAINKSIKGKMKLDTLITFSYLATGNSKTDICLKFRRNYTV